MQLSEIFVYPIKSMKGISLPEAQLTDRGLALDRRWMLVDPEGMFLTARKFPRLLQMQVSIESDGLIVQDMADLAGTQVSIPFDHPAHTTMEVEVWGDRCMAHALSPEIDQWFSEQIGQPCHLVYMPDDSHRPVEQPYAQHGEGVSFADGYPNLLIGKASLHHLNEKLETPVGMDRFRPNFIVDTEIPHEEDTWQTFRIGDLSFSGAKPCARCVMITINSQTGEKGKEPTATLANYRKFGSKILFGMNLLHNQTGTLRVGDSVEIDAFQANPS
ncbi:MOSC N-terminal beta barrel domain-containing protein [Pontibacter sp. G13]|uniref:MOSC domain-containing protein n=1 Tax=Pontibacter sp. G13 TaxID=3074898 RepID=UPI002889A499|nr:MOSC N-terminal beta barrel domain-containing protein [Pontibacter sp. G13]WNJ16698.1 MOSC domain-containing protein [Pontibacter sp. G13]